MTIQQTFGKSAVPIDKKLIHLYNVEQPLIAYGIDLCSFYEYVDAVETNLIFFIRFNAPCLSNIKLSEINPKYIKELQPGAIATTKESAELMREKFSLPSIEFVEMIVEGYIIIDDDFGSNGL